MAHAEWLRLSDRGGYSVAEVLDPWHPGAVLCRYVLEPRPGAAPDSLAGTRVAVPIRRAVSGISAHVALAYRLRAGHCFAGLTDAAYAISPVLRRALAEGRLADCGDGMSPDIEAIAALRPTALLLSPYAGGGYGAAESLGVPIIACADYMEATPLGRAEWVRFYGRLYGRAAEADSIFREEERKYRGICEKCRGIPGPAPRLMADCPTGDAWYVPGGHSCMARMFADAGFDYAFAGIPQGGGVPLSFETVATTAYDAGVWLIRTPASLTYATLLAQDRRHGRFPALRRRNVWLCNTLRRPYHDEVPFAPSLLLADLAALRRGTARPDTLRYFEPMAEE